MKKTLLLTATAIITGSLAIAQQFPVPVNVLNVSNTTLTRHASTSDQQMSNEKDIMAVCSDKVTYVDNNGTGDPSFDYAQIGGVEGWDNAGQVFPDYTGQVIRIDIKAQTYSGTATVQASIHALNASNQPTGAPLASGIITVNSALGEYGANLTSPANVTNGFAVLIWDLEAGDSVKTMLNADGLGGWTGYSYLQGGGSAYNIANDFGIDSDHLFRPTIQFNTRSITMTANPTTSCTGQPVNFTYVFGATPTHYESTMYNPSGVTKSLDFGDGSPFGTVMPTSHSYASSGSMNAQLTETYVGWSSNCPSDPSAQTVTITPGPTSVFSWASTGLAVQFNELCENETAYSWAFGDAGVSAAPNPVHNYATSGTYTVELTATGPCGSDYFTTNITISDTTNGGNVGISEVEVDFHLGIYPNPSNGKFTVEMSSADTDNLTIDVVSPVGEIISHQEFTAINQLELPLDLTNFASGTYFVHIKRNGKEITRPVVIK